MPFGSLLGAIVFGILGPFLGIGFVLGSQAPTQLKGASLILLGISIAGGLLLSRPWARWMGVLAAIWFGWISATAFLARGSVFPLVVLLASAATGILLLLPMTGRVRRDPAAPMPTSRVSRVLLAASCLAVAGFLGSIGWAVARAPSAPTTVTAGSGEREAAPAVAPASPLTWKDFADGIKEAKAGRKLVVADFYATWCGPCKIMEKRTFRDPRVMERLRDVVPVRVDAEETVDRGGLKGVDLALRYSVEVYPTIVVVDGTGRELGRTSGVLSPDEFLAWLDAVMERAQAAVAQS